LVPLWTPMFGWLWTPATFLVMSRIGIYRNSACPVVFCQLRPAVPV